MGSTYGAASRIEQQQRQMNGKDVICKRCGGIWFVEKQCTKYLEGYGTVEFTPDSSAQTFNIIVCLCGYPVTPQTQPGRRPGGQYEVAHKSLRDTVSLAQKYLDSIDPKETLETILEAVAGKPVENKVEDLQDRVSLLEAKVLAPVHEAQETKSQ